MSKITYCTKIFDPLYVYRFAARQTGEHEALKFMLNTIDNEHLILTREEDFEKVYPIRTYYLNYKRNIAVLNIDGDTYRCQTFIDGMVEDYFDLFDSSAESFFKNASNELTVIDYFSGKEIKPSYENVTSYAKAVLKAEKALTAYNDVMDSHKQQLDELKKECDVLYACSPSVYYKKGVNMLENMMEELAELFFKKHRDTIKEIESYLYVPPRFFGLVKTFGLYVYAINYGLEHKRFLKRAPELRPHVFSKVLSDCRKFIAENEGVVDKYIDYMQLNRNERERLIYMLSSEDLMTNGSKFIGDDLFC